MKLSIIIPAYNEEKRIKETLLAYASYFIKKESLSTEIIIVLNGCTDNTKSIVQSCMQNYPTISLIDLGPTAGKGIAIITGFKDALTKDANLIGFVDADMATSPEAFNQLIENIADYDGIIASRYMPGSKIYPERPKWKRLGSQFIYEPLIRLLFGLSYFDYQCGAKLFTRHVIEKIITELSITQWALDLELLFLCKKNNLSIKELPTVWHDKHFSKLTLRGGVGVIGSVILLRLKHSFLRKFF